MQHKNRVYLSLGSNIHPRHYFMAEAERLLQKNAGTIVSQSSLYESESWGFEAATPFLNSIVILDTDLDPFGLLKVLKSIEKELGRMEKGKPYKSRKIDIDIIAFNHDIINTKELTIPHAFMADRRFVLMPLTEVDPHWKHPVLQKSSTELLNGCKDSLEVTLLKNQPVNAV